MQKGVVRVALAQMNVEWEDKTKNQTTCEELVAKAANRGVDIVIFPEMTLTGFSMNVAKVGELNNRSQTTRFFADLASKYKLGIVFGVVEKTLSAKGANTAIFVDRSARVKARYQKIHPFSFSGEHKHFISGEKLSFFTVNGLRFVLAICYDLRFPGMFEAISRYKPDATIVIANWPQQRISHWKTLLCARSLDLQSYVIGVNRLGDSPVGKYNGESTVYDPGGKAILKLNNKAGVGYVDLKKADVLEARRKFPSVKDKKFSVYKNL